MERILHRLAAGFLLALGLCLAPAGAAAQQTPGPTEFCPGCTFEDPDIECSASGPQDCQSALHVTVESIPGDCTIVGPDHDCEPLFPCLVWLTVEYTSDCGGYVYIITPGGTWGPFIPVGPAYSWTEVIDTGWIEWPCDTSLDLSVRITDTGGGTVKCDFRLHCTQCFGD